MKKSYIVFILSALSCSISSAQFNFNCELKDNGDVYMNTTLVENDNEQQLHAYIGTERWSQPYLILRKCEYLKTEIIGLPIEKWSNYECENYEESVSKKYILFDLSTKGRETYKNDTLYFSPMEPLASSFVRYKKDLSCDPY